MSASVSDISGLVSISPRTRLKGFEPGGNNVVARHPARNIRAETAAPEPAAKPQGKIISVVIKLKTPSAGRIYRGLAKDEIVQDETVRGLVNVCEKHDDAWISLMRDGQRGHSGPVYAGFLEAQVPDHHVEPFRREIARVPGIERTFIPRS